MSILHHPTIRPALASARTAGTFSEKTEIVELKWSFEYFSASIVKWLSWTGAGVETAVANTRSIDGHGGCRENAPWQKFRI